MVIRFISRSVFAIRVHAGGLNAVSGEPATEDAYSIFQYPSVEAKGNTNQDYVVTPKQSWLGGMANNGGGVRQFVAMPQNSEYHIDYQASNEELIENLRFEITPSTRQVDEIDQRPHQKYRITVKILRGNTLVLGFNSDETRIDDVKARIQEEEGIPSDWQRLIWAGAQLENGNFPAFCRRR